MRFFTFYDYPHIFVQITFRCSFQGKHKRKTFWFQWVQFDRFEIWCCKVYFETLFSRVHRWKKNSEKICLFYLLLILKFTSEHEVYPLRNNNIGFSIDFNSYYVDLNFYQVYELSDENTGVESWENRQMWIEILREGKVP
jgi:hypothetical protein